MRKSARPGYTLLELMIVLVIVAIVGSIGMPKMGLSRFRADSAMRTAQAALQQAERSAVQRQTDVMVSFDTLNSRIRVLYDVNNNHSVDAGEEVRWKPLEDGNHFATPPSGMNGEVSTPIVGSNISTSGDGYPSVYYRRDGAASTGFEVYIRSSSDDLNDFRGLGVTQATGRVDLYRYGSGRWRKASL